MTTRPHEQWRSLDSPFATTWHPEKGTCSRCGAPAWLGETRWWHDGTTCPSRGRTAEFVPDTR